MPNGFSWLSKWVGASKHLPIQRKSAKTRLGLESLETRAVLNAAGLGGIGGLHPFAELSGRIAGPSQPGVVEFQIQPAQIVSDRGVPIILGLKAVAANGSTVLPKITKISAMSSRATEAVFTKGGTVFLDATLPLSAPATYKVQVKGLARTSGQFQVDVFLPGDVNGDGRVDRVDLARLRAAYGSKAGGPRYLPSADFGQTGKVGLVDLGVTRRNLGTTLAIVGVNQAPRGFSGSA